MLFVINFIEDIFKKIFTLFSLILVGSWIIFAFALSFCSSLLIEQYQKNTFIDIIKIVVGILSICCIGSYIIVFLNTHK
jgi:hypothetical protein